MMEWGPRWEIGLGIPTRQWPHTGLLTSTWIGTPSFPANLIRLCKGIIEIFWCTALLLTNSLVVHRHVLTCILSLVLYLCSLSDFSFLFSALCSVYTWKGSLVPVRWCKHFADDQIDLRVVADISSLLFFSQYHPCHHLVHFSLSSSTFLPLCRLLSLQLHSLSLTTPSSVVLFSKFCLPIRHRWCFSYESWGQLYQNNEGQVISILITVHGDKNSWELAGKRTAISFVWWGVR